VHIRVLWQLILRLYLCGYLDESMVKCIWGAMKKSKARFSWCAKGSGTL
jgi:hypothetical protein